MKIFYAGLRRSDMKARTRFPIRILFTFDDVSRKHGGGEQVTLFRQFIEYRNRQRKK